MNVGYGKIGRTMSLTLDGCGSVGGDHEPLAVLIQLAKRHPDDKFFILGRNSGEEPSAVGLPSNVYNPWYFLNTQFRRLLNERIIVQRTVKNQALTIDEQLVLADIFRELTQDLFLGMDAHIWWVGQHGTSNSPIAQVSDPTQLTKPQDWCAYYASYIFAGINAWRDVDPWNREEVYLNADPRNRHKMRDLKWPLRHPVLTQYNFTNRIKHERYGDPSHFEEFSALHDAGIDAPDMIDKVWNGTVENVYSRIEMNSLIPGTPSGNLVSFNDDFDRAGQFGLFINEARANGIRPELTRLDIMHRWVMPLHPLFVHGTWSKRSWDELFDRWGVNIEPLPPARWDRYYPLLQSVRCTFTTPSSGSGWATTKPWEAFAAGTVCFFHPAYDDQDNILRDAPDHLRTWLRVKSPDDLMRRVRHVNENPEAFGWLVREQRAHFDKAVRELTYMKMIEKRIWTSS